MEWESGWAAEQYSKLVTGVGSQGHFILLKCGQETVMSSQTLAEHTHGPSTWSHTNFNPDN